MWFNKNLLELLSKFEELIDGEKYMEAKDLSRELYNLYQIFEKKLKISINQNTDWIFLWEDDWLKSLNISEKIKLFLTKLDEKYWNFVFDEISIFKYDQNNLIPTYFYSINIDRVKKAEKNINDKKKLKDELESNMSYFLDDISKKWWLQVLEWSISWLWYNEAYDAVLRVWWNYIIGFNNTIMSLEDIKHTYWLEEKQIIKEITSFFYRLI